LTLAPASAWAGNPVQVRGAGVGRLTGAVLQIGAYSLPLSRVDDTTLSAVVPDTISGEFPATMTAGGRIYPLETLHVHGFVRRTVYPGEQTLWSESPEPYPRGSGKLLGSTDAELFVHDLDAGTFTRVGVVNRYDYNRAPGPTFEPGVWIVADWNGMPATWRLFPTPVKLDSFPGTSVYRQAMLLGPDQWWWSSHHWLNTTKGGEFQAEESQGALMSPRFDRATQTINGVQNPGIPVWSVPDGELVWSAPLWSADASAFRADGDVLLIAGRSSGPGYQTPSRFMAFRASDGTVLHDTTLAERVSRVAFDDDRPYIYVAVDVPAAVYVAAPAILVLDKDTYHVVARLAVPANLAVSTCCYFGALISSRATNRLYFYFNNGPATVYEFSLP
jgi:hypothetical protein